MEVGKGRADREGGDSEPGVIGSGIEVGDTEPGSNN
jgi:hypothetical protein